MKKVWDEIQGLEEPLTCSCGIYKNCTCTLLKQILERENHYRLWQFLPGLNYGFNSIRSNILAMEPLPSVNCAYYLVQQSERQKQVTGSINFNQEVNALFAHKPATGASSGFGTGENKDTKKDKNNRKCTHYKLKGHSVEQCFQLIGYPDWFEKMRSKREKSNAASTNTTEDTDMVDSPLCNATTSLPATVDPQIMNLIYQEVMKNLKQPTGNHQDNGSSSYASIASANFAGPFH